MEMFLLSKYSASNFSVSHWKAHLLVYQVVWRLSCSAVVLPNDDRNCTILSRYSAGIQREYTCRGRWWIYLCRNTDQRALYVSKSAP
jgi:hypothetical protein